MKKALTVMKFACDCLVKFVMKKEDCFTKCEISPDTDAETLAEILPEKSSDKKVSGAEIAAGVAIGLTAATAVACLKRNKRKKH